MTTLGERLKQLRKEKDLTQEEFGKILNISRQAVSNYEKNRRVPDFLTIEKIADYYNVDLDYLYGRTNIRNKLKVQNNFKSFNKIEKEAEAVKIPMVGIIAAGTPVLAIENIEGYFSVDKRVKADFALKVKGDSMIEADIFDGDIAFIRKQSILENGEIGAVLLGEEATLKKFYIIT